MARKPFLKAIFEFNSTDRNRAITLISTVIRMAMRNVNGRRGPRLSVVPKRAM